MKIKPLLMATALAISGFAATSSYATNYVVPLTGPVGPNHVWVSPYAATVATPGSFTDTFTFTPALSGTALANITSFIFRGQGVSLTSASLNGNAFSLNTVFGPFGSETSGILGPLGVISPLILTVTGSTIAGGTYSGNFAIAAVPEPETYAMMLAGLGLVGFMARRRRKTESEAALPQLSAC